MSLGRWQTVIWPQVAGVAKSSPAERDLLLCQQWIDECRGWRVAAGNPGATFAPLSPTQARPIHQRTADKPLLFTFHLAERGLEIVQPQGIVNCVRQSTCQQHMKQNSPLNTLLKYSPKNTFGPFTVERDLNGSKIKIPVNCRQRCRIAGFPFDY